MSDEEKIASPTDAVADAIAVTDASIDRWARPLIEFDLDPEEEAWIEGLLALLRK
jgi:hypothetical protein